MTKRTWTLDLEDGTHTVHLNHGYFSGKRTITVDGRPVVQSASVKDAAFDTGSRQAFTIAGHPCEVRIETPNGLTYRYDLVVDGRSATTGRPVGARLPMPGWGWAFVALCALIPLVTLGGLVPVVLGIGGAFGCHTIATTSGDSRTRRIAACTALTLTVWLLLVVFLTLGDQFPLRRLR